MGEVAGGATVRGAGSAMQYAKNVLLVDTYFRKFTSILFLDADGVVAAPVQPLLQLPLPAGVCIAMPTWGSVRSGYEGLYEREINFLALRDDEGSSLRSTYPDRTAVGLTAWFLLKPSCLP